MAYEPPAAFSSMEELLEEWKKPEFVAYMAKLYALEAQKLGEDFETFRLRCMAALRPTSRGVSRAVVKGVS